MKINLVKGKRSNDSSCASLEIFCFFSFRRQDDGYWLVHYTLVKVLFFNDYTNSEKCFISCKIDIKKALWKVSLLDRNFVTFHRQTFHTKGNKICDKILLYVPSRLEKFHISLWCFYFSLFTTLSCLLHIILYVQGMSLNYGNE